MEEGLDGGLEKAGPGKVGAREGVDYWLYVSSA
jgi:hypothetical protein